MRTKLIALLLVVSILLGACAQATRCPGCPAGRRRRDGRGRDGQDRRRLRKKSRSRWRSWSRPLQGPNPEAVIQGVEPNAEITFWTFWLSPTFDDYINSTIARFQATYPASR
jgi:ABC-type glycerol-3-phosphate transport system substrate-binding protein